MAQPGKLVISLDFELMWGVRDKRTIADYGRNIRAVHQVIPRLLSLFQQYDVRATFAAVGFLYFQNKRELLAHIPAQQPAYTDANLSPYGKYIDALPDLEEGDEYHFAPKLLRMIQQTPGQELATHTYSHYYCLEAGQTAEAFRADMAAAKKRAEDFGHPMYSLVFPRNQFNETYLEICRQLGIKAFRGNEHSLFYEARGGDEERLWRRAFRLADAYINLSGHNTYTDQQQAESFPVNIPSSRFLRPWSSRLRWLEPLRHRRITNSMTYAAKTGQTFHLWWHPHNFGAQTDANMRFLEGILRHYQKLRQQYGFQSVTMAEQAEQIRLYHER